MLGTGYTMKILKFTLPLFLFFIVTGCSNYTEIITIEKDSYNYIYGYDGDLGDKVKSKADSLGTKLLDETQNGFTFVNDGNYPFNDSGKDISEYLACDTVGDTLVYNRPLMIYLSNQDSDTTSVAPYIVEKTFTSTIKTKYPIVWTNGDLITATEARFRRKISIWYLLYGAKEREFVVKCLHTNEPNKLNQQKQITTSKAKSSFSKFFTAVRLLFTKLFTK